MKTDKLNSGYRRGFDTFYGTYLGVLDHFTHIRDKYDGYDFHKVDLCANYFYKFATSSATFKIM